MKQASYIGMRIIKREAKGFSRPLIGQASSPSSMLRYLVLP